MLHEEARQTWDLACKKQVKALGRERGTTTIMVTHDNRILDMADRIITMEDGRLVSDTAS